MFLRRSLLMLGCVMAMSPGWLLAQADSPETPAARRERIETMTAEEKAELRRKQESFVNLTEAEQVRMRELHNNLEAREDGERLHQVLERYHAWLATLSSAERTEVLSLPPDKRVEKIRTILQKQEDERFRKEVSDKLTREDREAIMKWLTAFVEAHQDEIREATPPEQRSPDRDRQPPPMFVLLRGWGENNQKMPRPSADDVQALLKDLSPGAQATLQSVNDPEKRMEVAQRWIKAAIWSRSRWAPPPVDKEELRKFYAETLTVSERERLEALTPQEMQKALQRMYYEHRFRRGGGGGGPQRGRDGGRDGGGRDGGERRFDKKGPPPAPPEKPTA
jgi:hypothetical protein